jgi:type VI protein secretion system component Hcp
MAAADIFLELISLSGSQVKGESQDDAFPFHIELKSFSLRGPSFTSRQRDEEDKYDDDGKRVLKPPKSFTLTITKDVDKSTPTLVQTYSKNLGVNSQPFSKAIVRCRLPHAGSHLVFLALIFTEVHLTKYDVDLKGETSIPEESINFAFKGLEIQYSPQTNTGDASSKLMTAAWPPPSSSK